jgi:predicted SnoaL-like aldol condensation-catalyzing enzyme
MGNNKDIAVEFLQLAASGRARQAFERHAARGFRHHNPHFSGEAEPLMLAMDENAREHPDKALEVKRVLADGDLVAVHSHVRHDREEPGFALVHIFRFEGGKIAELWDLAQEIPADSPNRNGMF